MKTKTIELDKKYYTIELEVSRDGTPVKAEMRALDMEGTAIECLQAVKESKVLMFEIQQQVEAMDWDDNGDCDHSEPRERDVTPIESFKDQLASIVGVKQA